MWGRVPLHSLAPPIFNCGRLNFTDWASFRHQPQRLSVASIDRKRPHRLSASGAMFLQKQRMSDRSGLLQKLLSKISLAGLATGNLACETDVASNPTNLRIFRPEPFDGCHRQTSSTNVKIDIRGSRSARSPADLAIGSLLPRGMDKSEDMRNVPLR